MIRSNKIRRWMGDGLAACATLLRINNVINCQQRFVMYATVVRRLVGLPDAIRVAPYFLIIGG